MQIKNQIVLITGASSGIGAGTARYLAAQGAKLALVDIELSKLTALATELNAFAVQCDVSNEESVAAALSKMGQHWGSAPRVCINCAGILSASRLIKKAGTFPLSDFQHTLAVNLVGTFNVMRLTAKAMSELPPLNEDGERGVIINTASIAAFEGQIGQVAYSASKGGVVAMTLPAARELAQFGIRVMAIAPGLIKTPLFTHTSPEVLDNLMAGVPFPKRLGTVSEYARLVLQIVENAYLNGSVIRLDGSLRMNA